MSTTTLHPSVMRGERITARVGLADELVRVLNVTLRASKPCAGSGDLHLARGVRFRDGSPVSWFVTDEQARKAGWLR